MLKREVTYVNFDGVEITETVYFNLSKSELLMWESSEEGGLSNRLKKILDKKSGKDIMKTFHDTLLKAYGEKSDDGRRFMKSDELSKAFSETPAFDIIFNELLSDPEKALQFIKALMPEDIMNRLTEGSTDA